MMQSSLNYTPLYTHMDNTNNKSITYNPKRWPECPLKDSLSYHFRNYFLWQKLH